MESSAFATAKDTGSSSARFVPLPHQGNPCVNCGEVDTTDMCLGYNIDRAKTNGHWVNNGVCRTCFAEGQKLHERCLRSAGRGHTVAYGTEMCIACGRVGELSRFGCKQEAE